MYAMRGYAFTEEDRFLNQVRESLAGVKSALGDSRDLNRRAPHLTKLDSIGEEIRKYEGLVARAVAVNAKMVQNRKDFDVAAEKYLGACYEFLNAQNQKIETEVANGLPEAKIDERRKKIILVNDIIDLGNATRLAAWQSQGLCSPKIVEDANQNFKQMQKKVETFRPITRDAADIQRINQTEAAANAYQTAMITFLDNWRTNEQLARERDMVGDEPGGHRAGRPSSSMEKMASTSEEFSSQAKQLRPRRPPLSWRWRWVRARTR